MRNPSSLTLLVGSLALVTLAACGGRDKAEPPPGDPAASAQSGPLTDQGSPEYIASIKTWQEEREERMRSETGWLTVAGFFWLKDGDNTFGSGPENDMVFPAGACPERAGVLRMLGPADHRIFEVVPAKDVELGREEKPFPGGEISPGEDVLTLGRLSFWILERGGNYAVRLRDPEYPLRAAFTGIDTYPIRESYRVEGRLEPFDPPRMVQVPNIMGYVDSSLAPGRVVFTLEGRSMSLMPIIDDPSDTTMFFVFEDATSGGETYGGGRFLYSPLEPDGSVVLDFNRAYNPPCAFNENTTCPLPPEGNKLALAVRAGEKAYAGKGH